MIEFIRFLVEKIIDRYFEELRKVWRALVRDLRRVWSFRASDLWYLLLPLAAPIPVINRILGTLEAIREFNQDLGLIPQRIVADVADDAIPVPDSWKHRVMRGDQALRFFVQEVLYFAVNLQDLDLPPEIDAAKLAEKYFKVDDLFRNWDARKALRLAKASAIFQAVLMLGRFLQIAGAIVLVMFAGWIVYRAHQEDFSERTLLERALSQDSRRVRRRRGRRQFRVNRKPGPDI